MKKLLFALLAFVPTITLAQTYEGAIFHHGTYADESVKTAKVVPTTGTPYWTLQSKLTKPGFPDLIIETKDCDANYHPSFSIPFKDNNNVWNENSTEMTKIYGSPLNIFDKSNALIAHYTLVKLAEQLNTKFSWYGFDNKGTKLIAFTNIVDATKEPGPAWGTYEPAGSIGFIRANITDPEEINYAMTAHEFAHGVNKSITRSEVIYPTAAEKAAAHREYAAILEGICDIYGAYFTYEVLKKPTWEMKNLDGNTIRNLSNPSDQNAIHQCPEYYMGCNNWYTGSNFSLFAHINSTVLSHWFYLLATGKSGMTCKNEPYCISKIDINKAFQIVFEMQKTFPADGNYQTAYDLSISRTAALFGNTSAELLAVREAWFAVGVGPRRNANRVFSISNPNWNCSTTSATFKILTDGVLNSATPAANWTVSGDVNSVVTTSLSGVTQVTVTRNGTATGVVTISASIPQSCGSPIALQPIQFVVGKVPATPLSGYVDPCAGRAYAEVPKIPGATYNWYLDGVLKISNSTNNVAWITTQRNAYTTSYTVSVEASYSNCGVSNKTSKVLYPIDCGGVYLTTSTSPNPANNRFKVNIPNKSSSSKSNKLQDDNKTIIIVYDTQGRKVREYTTSGSTQEIDSRDLPNGIYFTHIKNKFINERKKILIQH